ncbi:MAG: ketopantoate reductase family protein [Hyphomicrobiaceae bacterium TMED74]|nr:2-dehydropantoate 2-reductase [Filomicrobium sp.]RPG48318.1 MAG: ketopantoate reductase family protein [Hyphomicrobiaceae bacterium TMED74]
MKVMVLGAGAVGGYFGGRMTAAGSDVTFLVREKRAVQLSDGLRIESPLGDATIPVKTFIQGDVGGPFDLIILSCKSYGLANALDAITPHVNEGTVVVPLLNGYAHVEQLEQRFPSAIISGGTAGIIATLTEDGTVRHMRPNQFISVGPRRNNADPHGMLEELVSEMKRADIDATLSSNINLAMWEKWTFLATLAASTCLMRCSIGSILETDHGEKLIEGLFDECNSTACAEGYPPGPSSAQLYRGILFERNSMVTASMLRDLEAGSPTEAEHIIGDMIKRAAQHGIETPLLKVANTHLQAYENARHK